MEQFARVKESSEISTTDFKGPKSCISGGEPGSNTRGDVFQRGVWRDSRHRWPASPIDVNGRHVNKSPCSTLKSPLPCPPSIWAVTMQMIQGRAETEKLLPWLSEQCCSQFNLHLCVFYRVGRTERIQTDHEVDNHLGGFTVVTINSRQQWLQGRQASKLSFLVRSSLSILVFCFHVPCGVPFNLFSIWPLFAHLGPCPGQSFLPELTPIKTLFIPAIPRIELKSPTQNVYKRVFGLWIVYAVRYY